ncbi:NACHT domain-containing protein [Rhizobium sp. FKL33]|uniref:NACHT domain-containing protein n=1 Tax=Rhizobium sp. FKL33 TaxID=2562307 RepID=UPI0010BFD5BD|nr:NACHT domain-containing protein [Rhizobium sp. FKL33]
MTKKREWATFEDRVRDIASYIWSRPCTPKRVGGVNIDGVTVLDAEIECFVEITVERSLNKVREDVVKLQTAKSAAFIKGVLARCFCVVNGPVTPAMKDAGKDHNIHVVSFEEFSKQFFDFNTYGSARSSAPFGSSINPLTGQADETKYVPVRYLVDGKKGDISSKDVADLLRSGRNVILLGEYGSGKSRCIREVFSIISGTATDDFCYPIAIDLRKSWGLRQSGELIRRHFADLGLDGLESSAIKAFRANSLVFLLDGFDEIGSQAWSNDNSKLKLIRAKSLEGVKDIVQSNGGGTLVAGREHYFPSMEEMYSALGMSPNNTVVVRSKNEFSDSELLEYFQNRDIDVDIPDWLPRRPLICQTISELATDQLESMFGERGNEISFWNHFINVLCQRDANIHVSFDAATILRIFIHLARLTRAKPSNVGPISLAELQGAFEAATGAAPVEEASIMLQRLPSLGRVGPESNDRQFVDIYILDGLRAKDVALIGVNGDQEIIEATSNHWTNPLDDLGQRILASDQNLSEKTKLQIASRAAKNGNKVLASDIVGALSRRAETPMDFEGLTLSGGEFLFLPLDERPLRNLTITDGYIGELAFPAKGCVNVRIDGCISPKVTGISSQTALPSWVSKLEAEEFDSVASVSRIRKIGLKPAHEILITIIRKTFFQKGAGRKEEALLRGLGTIAGRGLSTRILNLMLKEGLLTTFKGDEGSVYSPVRSHTRRMQSILDQLSASTDSIWQQVDEF